MRHLFLTLSLAFLGAAGCGAVAGEPPAAGGRLDELVLAALRTVYPDAELRRDRDSSGMHVFARNLRGFVIYRTDKAGEWQKPLTVQGPDRGGFSVRFYVGDGPWGGALLVPYNGIEDMYVFKETHVVRNLADGTHHLWAEILTPRVDAPDALRDRLVAIFNEFATRKEK